MSEAIDTAAPDNPCTICVLELLKPPHVGQQGPGIVAQKGNQLTARLSPDTKLDLWRRQNTLNGWYCRN